MFCFINCRMLKTIALIVIGSLMAVNTESTIMQYSQN